MLSMVVTPAAKADTANNVLTQILEPRLPSWVPDWRLAVKMERFVDHKRVIVGNLSLYNPCPRKTVEACIQGKELVLRGAIANDISIGKLSKIWDDSKRSLVTPRAWHDEFLAMATNESKETLDTAIRRCLVGDLYSFYRFKKTGFDVLWKRGGTVNWSLLDLGHDQLQNNQSAFHERESMYTVLVSVGFGRRLAQLTDGRVSILPAAAKVGDKIAAFFGGSCLYLIRPLPGRPDAYTFVGECYVDGLMDGAFLDICERAGDYAKRIVLV